MHRETKYSQPSCQDNKVAYSLNNQKDYDTYLKHSFYTEFELSKHTVLNIGIQLHEFYSKQFSFI